MRVFQTPGNAEAFLKSVFDALPDKAGATLIIGGDGRFLNREVIQTALRVTATDRARDRRTRRPALHTGRQPPHPPAWSDRRSRPLGQQQLGRPRWRFRDQVKHSQWRSRPGDVTEAIDARTRMLSRYLTLDMPDLSLDSLGESRLGPMAVEVVDPVSDYAALMKTLFDFDAICIAMRSGLALRFDALHAVTGPYAVEIFERRLGFPPGTVVNATPLPDFGGGHPDPNLVHAHALHALMMSPAAPDVGAASDGDGDCNLIIGRGRYVSPSDALAVLAANAHLAPAYRRGVRGVARSMPTSAAVDRVADALGVPAFETPTGWKFFGNLLDAGRVTLCGEESAGAVSDHVREKDGLWAVFLWLNILALRDVSVDNLVQEHWARFGRQHHARHDHEDLEATRADCLICGLRSRLRQLPGTRLGPWTIDRADEFAYTDPVDGSVSTGQGLRILFEGGARIVYRLSGTGTFGATLRVYLERYEPPSGLLEFETESALVDLAAAADALAGIGAHTGRFGPDVVT